MSNSTYEHVIMNPLDMQGDIVTERKTIKPGKYGWGKTKDAGLAQEIKQRYPWMIVREFENGQNGRATRPTFTMPQMPWKPDPERQQQFVDWFNKTYQELKEKHEKESNQDHETDNASVGE